MSLPESGVFAPPEETVPLRVRLNFWLRLPAACLLFAAAVLWGTIVLLFTRSPARCRNSVSRIMAGPICRVLQMDVRIEHAERLSPEGRFVLVANHQSLACHMVLANVYRRYRDFVVVAKLVGKWDLPLVVPLFRRTGNIIVDPANAMRNGVALRAARAALDRGAVVGLYPEGTRGQDTRRIAPFRNGAFLLAVDAGVPIVPVVLSRFKPRFDPDARRLEPQCVRVHVLEPIPTAHLARADLPELRARTHRVMQDALDRMSADA